MSTPRLYISGPMTGLPDYNRPAFNSTALQLRRAGYEVVNPVDNGLPESSPWHHHMRADIGLLMRCDAVAWLPGWHQSKGAKIEIELANKLLMPCHPVGYWMSQRREVAHA